MFLVVLTFSAGGCTANYYFDQSGTTVINHPVEKGSEKPTTVMRPVRDPHNPYGRDHPPFNGSSRTR